MAERDQDDADADADGLDNEQEGSYGEDGVRRPMNAFFIFCKRHRDVVREKYPHLENRSITKILGEWWANLDASEKSSYTALAKQYKEAFMKAHPDFKWYKLPTAPARTLVTRPSNNRCVQSKKEKCGPKTASACGIALGKIADEKELGGLSSLISQSSAETSPSAADTDNHDVAVTSVCISPPSSSSSPPSSSSSSSSATSNILKPPKKRYIVNGEFKCSSEQTKCDSRDYQTQNACSALMELAEICANTAGQSRLPVTTANTSAGSGLYKSIFTYPRSTDYKSYSVLNTCSTSALQPSSVRCDPMKCRTSTTSVTYFQNVSSSSVCSSEFLPRNPVTSIPDIQEQPLNLCKEKEKTFTASNQQLINHLVDKFLCDTPSAQSVSPSSLSLECSSSPAFPKSSQIRQGFTLSAAIESAIDQAYSKTSPKSPAVSPVTKKPASATVVAASDPEEPPETVFIDKIKKACLASSRIQSEKLINSRYSLASSAFGESSKPAVVKEEEQTGADIKPEGSESRTDTVKNESTGDSSCNLKREAKFSSSKYYSKYASPPKKSRVWCNLFMKEQLSNCELDGNTDAKNAILFDLASPVRRNSQRTCKGRRYQALITEGLLQSSKERKSATGRKPLPTTNEKCKSKTSPTPQSPPPPLPKSKRKKKELWKAKAEEEAEEASTAAKSEFDLNEKIASLPKCSLETLNKKKKGTPSSEPCTVDSKSSSSSATKAGKKAAKESNTNAETADKVTEENSAASTGRFKTGGFDLEQHIASLPKCDIEVLNKRRNKKE